MTQTLLVKHLQQCLSPDQPDADLLFAFVARRDHDAFAALVKRYGPLVWSVCRRRLGDCSAADDATQTTFLNLARQAQRVRPETLAAWLVCVAQRGCRKARLADVRRRRREAAAAHPERIAPPVSDMSMRELLALMDEELHNLPLRYRSALLACYWQGLTQASAAHRLGTTAGVIKGLLERGRAKLLQRLRRRGVTADVALPGLLAAPLLLVALPDDLFARTAAIEHVVGAAFLRWLPSSRASRWLIGGFVGIALSSGLILFPSAEPPKTNQPTVEAPATHNPDLVDDDSLPDNALLRLGTLRLRHPNQANELALSPDGNVVVTLGTGAQTTEGMLIAWDTATGKRIWSKPAVQSFGNYFGEKLLAFTPDGKRLVTCGEKNSFSIWEMEAGKHRSVPVTHDTAGFTDRVSSVDVAPDGRTIAVGAPEGVFLVDFDGNARWQIANPRKNDKLRQQTDRLIWNNDCSFARFSPDGKVLAVVTSENRKVLRFRDPVGGKELRRIELAAIMVRLAFSPDSKRVAVTERDDSVRVYEVESGRRVHSWTAKLEDPVENYTSAVAWSPDGRTVAAAANDNVIYLWDAESGKETGRLTGIAWAPWSLAFSGNGKMLYSTGWDGVIRRWDLATNKQMSPPGGIRGTDAVAASPNGRLLAYQDGDGVIRLVDTKTGREVRQLKSEDGGFTRIVFSHDGRKLAAGGNRAEMVHISVWDTTTAKMLRQWNWGESNPRYGWAEDIVFSPDDARLAVALFNPGELSVLDLSGDGHRRMKHQSVSGVDFSPDGSTLASSGWDKTIRLWNPATGDLMREAHMDQIQADSRMLGIRYSPDGRSLATAHSVAHVYLWDAKTLQINDSFSIHTAFCSNALAYSPDGLRLATGDQDGHIRVSDSQTGVKLWEGGRMGGHAITVGFGRDGRAVIAGGDEVGYLWDTRPHDLPKKGIAEFWSDLTGTDAVDADRAFWALADQPDEAVKLLSKKVEPKREAAVDAKRVERLIAELVDDKFAKREAAEADLAKFGLSARSYLKKALATTDSAESRPRLSRLLERLVDDDVTRRRYQRLTGLLAQIETPEARKLLHEWADKAADSLAEYAAAAVKRIERQ